MPATDQRETIQAALRDFTDRPLADAAHAFLDTLGYRSDRTLDLGDSSPGMFLDYVRSHAKDAKFDKFKALFDDGKITAWPKRAKPCWSR